LSMEVDEMPNPKDVKPPSEGVDLAALTTQVKELSQQVRKLVRIVSGLVEASAANLSQSGTSEYRQTIQEILAALGPEEAS
jgi:hypothetical protein